ncbi:MerR family transcriptional regulator [Levilactobacillus sp. N40-8-2]|uniref:MerR family transcriptional regulator n=1 Tax=Levilactobacillus muriae TaxID=3238987 RepID=UPI0038B2E202
MKINEVAKLLHTSAWTLRYYEQVGVIAPIARTKGNRDYLATDVTQVRRVLDLRRCGLTLEEIKRLVHLRATTGTASIQQQILQTRAANLRHEITGLQSSLNRLDTKIMAISVETSKELSGNGTN